MELLIPGLALVALMVYASTKIKKKAASAYNEELVDTADFSLIKPEGFVNPVHPADGVLFEAYSKEFGKDENENTHRAWIKLNATDDDLGKIKKAIKSVADSIAEDPDAELMEVERTEGGTAVNAFYKFETAGQKLYELQAVVLREHKDDYLRKIQQAFESFKLKAGNN